MDPPAPLPNEANAAPVGDQSSEVAANSTEIQPEQAVSQSSSAQNVDPFSVPAPD